MTPTEILNRAADIIEEGGACKGVLRMGGKHCTLGALDAATGFGGYSEFEMASRMFPSSPRNIPHWNDSRPDHCITPEVAAFMRYAAEPERWDAPEVKPCAS